MCIYIILFVISIVSFMTQSMDPQRLWEAAVGMPYFQWVLLQQKKKQEVTASLSAETLLQQEPIKDIKKRENNE